MKRSGLMLLWTLHSAVLTGVGQPAAWTESEQREIHDLLYRGRYGEAEKRLQSHSEPVALRLRMELAERRGDRAEANRLARVLLQLAASGSLVTSTDIAHAAVGAWQLDRWHDANELFLKAAQTPPVYALLYIDWGYLYLEQYNPAEAESIFQDGINSPALASTPVRWGPAAAELGLALAMQAQGKPGWMELLNKVLEMDLPPLRAIAFRALVAVREDNWEDAEEWIHKGLALNRSFVELLELKAAAHYFRGQDRRFEKTRERLSAINPNNAELFHLLGNLCVPRRRLEEAIRFFRETGSRDPQHWQALSSLGINLLRQGEEEQGKKILEQAYANDPFNIWTVNTLRLLDSFSAFERSETDNFAVKISKNEAEVLRPYVVELLERSLTELSDKYDHQIEGKYTFEIYPNHEDFAVRTLGLPGLGALGATFGRVVAMDSPTAREAGTFHWGSTLWHEVAHVVTLALSDQKVPRWLTEGISMVEERAAGKGWGDYLTPPFIQAYEEGKLLSLGELNKGFERPEFPGQLQLSYLQAGLAAEFLLDRFGPSKIREVLVAYAQDQTSDEVFTKVLGSSLEDLDGAFQEVLEERVRPLVERVKQIRLPGLESSKLGLATLRQELENHPDNYWLHLTLGRLLLSTDAFKEALPHLEKAIQIFPYPTGAQSPYPLLLQAYEKLEDSEGIQATLRRWWSVAPEQGQIGRRLAFQLIDRSETVEAMKILQELMYVTPFEPELHKALGNLYLETEDVRAALTEFQVLLALRPNDLADAHFSLARALARSGQNDEAKEQVVLALEIAPSYQPAQRLLLQLVKQ